MPDDRFFFWAPQAGAEVDLFWQRNGKNYAAEFKYGDAPRRTKSMTTALKDLDLEHLWVIYPGQESYGIGENISVQSITNLDRLRSIFGVVDSA